MEYNFFNLNKNIARNALYFKKNDRQISLNKKIGLTISNQNILNIFNIRGNFKKNSLTSIVKKYFNINDLPKIGNFKNKDETFLLNIGPDEMLLIKQSINNKLIKEVEKKINANHLLMTEVSDHYQVLNLSGENVRWILSKGCPLNLDEDIFLPGKCAQTHLGYSNVILFCNEVNVFTLICVSSFSEYVLDWLKESAYEHGYHYTN